MEISSEQFQEIIARRLLTQAVGVDVKPVKDDKQRQLASQLAPVAAAISTAAPDFITVEKNLASFGFFTPSSKKIPGVKKKIISFTKTIDGKKIEVKAVILPSAEYGLPTTADQDKWFALQKIIADLFQHEGGPSNPISFTSAELLRELGKRVTAGKNYDDIAEWLQRMTLTGIRSEGVVYFAGKKKWATDTFHVVTRSINFGSELPDGTIADRNYIWLSEWQLENLRNNYFLPIDFETYKQLRNHIAKALVPLLQIWLYATREEGSFEKRYDELCQMLNIRQYPQISRIEEQLGPSLDELKACAYIAAWKVEKTNDRKSYKIVFNHGDKFYRDRNHRLGKKQKPKTLQRVAESTSRPEQGTDTTGTDPRFLELTKRGITEAGARKLMANLAVNQQIIDQLEWGDNLVKQGGPRGVKNPPGFYIYLVQNNVTVPETFETSRQRQLREESRAQLALAEAQRFELEQAYEDYQRKEVDQFISAMNPLEFEQILAEKRQGFLSKNKYVPTWDDDMLTKVARGAARAEVAKRIAFTTFEAFAETYHPSSPPETTVLEQNISASAPDDGDQFLTV